MFRRILCASVLLMFALALAAPVLAQESGPVYVRIELWDVKRAQWSAFVKMYEEYDKPVYEKLFADDVITEYGIESAMLHNPDEYTHVTWHAATSMEAFAKVREAFEAAYKDLGEEEEARIDTRFANMLVKHRDYIWRTDYQKARESKLENAYFYEASVALKPGQGSSYASYWNEYTKPLYQKLMDEGIILTYGRSREEIRTEGENRRWSWYVVRDLADHDKVQAAARDSWGRMSEEQRRARWASLREIVNRGSFREYMSRFLDWAVKEQ
jgi:hypothetical protein